ncbi:hypothetical protein DV096_17430 [Bradymonadaceae bacterium TMQ3]|uniref:O-antigen ligase domain-containing protein n=1 Tax=Lujinxingia sediminis TaxID=2480984 RepID=A0ABY0CNX9_9DELT|nr:hypothetical protein [Lujinxingia sediminis]RDV36864.1 hypothetical protein DV096_17430 [Bradymonadaceae bacterium TMQ3]RVU42155.1 hypothetical protein EA187_17610 [Lujinxingia sediminis]TXC69487.1 hypothetical protein FRC91_18010 [Bradymonadales bacterium TMQ1]
MARQKSRPLWLKVSSILLAILLLASPLMVGGVHALSAALLATLALVVVLIGEFAMEGRPTGLRRCSIPAAVFAMLGMVSLLQALPMPVGLINLVSPASGEALRLSWEAAFGERALPAFRPLSLDAPASAAMALKWFALSLGALAVSNLGRWRALRRQGLAAASIIAIVVALAGAMQVLSQTDKILGLYQASLHPRAWAPFVSTNHAATYYALATLVSAGAALMWARRQRALSATMMVFCAIFGVLTLAHRSEGSLLALGLAALAGGAVLFRHAATHTSDAPREKTPHHRLVWIGGGLAAALVIAGLLLPQHFSVADSLAQTSLEVRLHMSGAALRAAGDFWLTGAGAGAVGMGLPAYLDPHIVGMHSVPTIENEPVEWIFAYGWPVGIAAIALLGMSLVLLVRQALASENPRMGAIAVALAVGLSVASLFHFPFFTLGISLPALMIIELCVAGAKTSAPGYHRPLSQRLYRALVGALAAGILLACGLLWGLYDADAPDAEEQVKQRLALFPTDAAALGDRSVELRQAGHTERALALARRAYALNPFPHQGLVLARTLVVDGQHEEAARIWRELYAEPHLAPASWLGAFLFRDLHDIPHRALALGRASESLLSFALRECARVEGPAQAAELALAMLDERPQSTALRLGLIQLYREQKLWELSELWAGQLLAMNPGDQQEVHDQVLRELIQIYHRQERPEAALALAERALRGGWLSADVARDLLRVTAPDHRPDEGESDRQALLNAIYAIGCAPPLHARDQGVCWRSEAAIAEAQGDLRRARVLLERLVRHYDEPRDLGRFLVRHKKCIDLAAVIRDHGQGPHQRALRQLRSECARQP